MKDSMGLRNFVKNIEPIMLKCREGKRLHKDEQEQIVQFYLETIHVLTINAETTKEVNHGQMQRL